MTDKAAIWARPHIEKIANGGTVFNDSWAQFITEYKLKFEPVDSEVEAKEQIRILRQGDRLFSAVISDFEMWAERTG